jgi:hypothetical protein
VRDDRVQAVINHRLGMGTVLFEKWKVLLRTVYNVYVKVKLREFDHAVGYGLTRFKSKNVENCKFELQSVWITAHRWFDFFVHYITFLVLIYL